LPPRGNCRKEDRESLPVSSAFPRGKKASEHAHEYLNFPDGQAAAEGAIRDALP
jgi:hypothetical protein